jgi:Bacterial archaeo-eukaryotic release factor family 7
MNTIRYADLLQLINAPGDRFVSLYMPTYPAGRETPQNPIRFRELLKTAHDLLGKKGMCASDIHGFLAPAMQLLDRSLFWNAMSHGLAVLISSSELQVWRLPLACEELCIVGKRYHVTPLVAWFNDDAPYYVLSASQNHVRLLHGTRYQLQEVKVPSLPVSLTEALHYDPREGFFQTHSGEPHLRGKEGLVFTGQGGEEEVAKEEVASFFRMIDAAICRFLHGQTEPLVFSGVDYLYPIYREHNHYPNLLPKHISGNSDLLSPFELRERAWPLVEASIRQRQEAEVAKYWNLVGHGRGSNFIEEIIAAAYAGAVETLFICPAIRRMGGFDPHTNEVRLDEHPRSDGEDLANLAACLVLKNHGKVEVLVSGNIPGGGSMAAVFRYPLPLGATAAVVGS